MYLGNAKLIKKKYIKTKVLKKLKFLCTKCKLYVILYLEGKGDSDDSEGKNI